MEPILKIVYDSFIMANQEEEGKKNQPATNKQTNNMLRKASKLC